MSSAGGTRQGAVYLDDKDYQIFLDTLDEAYHRTGWRIHAYVLMGNHYHLLLETPHANLVAGNEVAVRHLYPAI